MDFRKLSDSALVDFAQNVAAQSGSLVGTAIPAALITTLTADATQLGSDIDSALNFTTSAQAATQMKNVNRAELIDTLAQIKQTMRANQNPDADFEIVGFGALEKIRTKITPEAPTNLVATGDSTNRNYLKWQGNNKSGSVVYVIEYLAGDTMPFTFLAQTKSQKFVHEDVTPGQVYNYRVRAEAANGDKSAWSNTAVVYGS